MAIFGEIFANTNKYFTSAGGLGTRISFYKVKTPS